MAVGRTQGRLILMDGLGERQLGDAVHPAETREVWRAYASFQHKIKWIYMNCPQQWKGRVMLWFSSAHLLYHLHPGPIRRNPSFHNAGCP